MMKSLPLVLSLALSFAVSGCMPDSTSNGLNPPAQEAAPRPVVDQNDIAPDSSSIRGSKIGDSGERRLLYVSNASADSVDIFSLPKLRRVGKITQGIYQPLGVAVDKNGTLYVSNYGDSTITEYPKGSGSPSATLTGYFPDDVAVANNGYVLAAGYYGEIDVYPPGATSPSARLTNPGLGVINGVAVDARNKVYAVGFGY